MNMSADALVKISRGLREAPQIADQELFAGMVGVTQGLEGEIKDAMPKRTGLTAGSVTSDAFSTPEGPVGVVASASPIALFLEEGTRPHEIRAVNAKALRFPMGAGGDIVFAKVVHHPGTKARRYFADTLARNEGNIVRQFEMAADRIAQRMEAGMA